MAGDPPRGPPRRATVHDLPLLLELERACYDGPRRSSPASLRRSIESRHQETWILDDDAVLILWARPRTWRVYGIHTRPEAQGRGLAHRLLAFGEQRARQAGASRMVLEADALDKRLVGWYEKRGYRVTATRPDFYEKGRPAVRMDKPLSPE